MYIWNNKMDGLVQNAEVLNNTGIHIQENRDYYNAAMPGYTPYPYPHPLRNDIKLKSESGSPASIREHLDIGPAR